MGYSQTQRNVSHGRRKPFRVDPKNPRAAALCDGCGFLVNRENLHMQKEYRGGSAPVDTGLLRCDSCLDKPQPYFKKLVLLPDPVPVDNPRPDDAGADGEVFPAYTLITLPSAYGFDAGYPVNVDTGGGTIVRAYADNGNWLRYDTNAVLA